MAVEPTTSQNTTVTVLRTSRAHLHFDTGSVAASTPLRPIPLTGIVRLRANSYAGWDGAFGVDCGCHLGTGCACHTGEGGGATVLGRGERAVHRRLPRSLPG